jgi:LCP family protein required for cell wall assembly
MATIILLAVASWTGWKVYAATSKVTGNSNPLQILEAFTPAQLKESNGRVTILIAGYSADDSGHQGATLTDSIMIVSIDQTNKKAVMLSVPRDLWVNVPGYGYQKINAVYQEGGMSLLEQVIQQDLGVDINYYAQINYTAVKAAVDAVGGITVNVQSSDSRGLYDPYTNINLMNGVHTIDGQTALNLTRSRGDGPGSYGFPNSDFDRIKNQQMVLLALKDKASNTSVISNPLKIATMVSALGDNVRTDLQINEMETVYSVMKSINSSNIQSSNISDINGQKLLADYTSWNGQAALTPLSDIDDFSQIQAAVKVLLQ